jgi:hypothetical protein
MACCLQLLLLLDE